MKNKQVKFCKAFILGLFLTVMGGVTQAQYSYSSHVLPPNTIYLSANTSYTYSQLFDFQNMFYISMFQERALAFKIMVAPNTHFEISLGNTLEPYTLAYLGTYNSGELCTEEHNHQFYYTVETGGSMDIVEFYLWYRGTATGSLQVNFTGSPIE